MYDSQSPNITKNHVDIVPSSKGKKLMLTHNDIKSNNTDIENYMPTEYNIALGSKTTKYTSLNSNTSGFSLSPEKKFKLMNLSMKNRNNANSNSNSNGNKSPNSIIQNMNLSLRTSQKFSTFNLKKKILNEKCNNNINNNNQYNSKNNILFTNIDYHNAHNIIDNTNTTNATNTTQIINNHLNTHNAPVQGSNSNFDNTKPHHRKNYASLITEKNMPQKIETNDTYNTTQDIDNKKLYLSSQGKFKISEFKFPKSLRRQKTIKDEDTIIETVNLTSPNMASKHTDLSLNDSKENIGDKKTSVFNSKREVNNELEVEEKTNEDGIIELTNVDKLSHQQKADKNSWSTLKLPVAPFYVLKNFNDKLCDHERLEILKYDEVYYISDLDHKIDAEDITYYADDKGDYRVIRNDHIAYRYEVIDMLGRGSFGQVLKVLDHKKKELAALKIIRNQKKFHFQAKIEIKILRYMIQNNGMDYNIVELKDAFIFRNHVVLVFDLMSHNLYDFMKQNKFKGCSLNLIRRFAIQVLYALKFLRKHKIIHCDLKPENILLKQANKSGIRLIDFGSSCFENEKLYSYIQSRFYRSPDIILGLNYTTQIDMWSFGCLLAELYTGCPLFPGESEHDQILAMMEILGIPPQHILDKSPRKKLFFDGDNPKIVPNSKGKYRYPSTIKLVDAINCPDANFLDLMRKCLEYDPDKRLTPDEALVHDWILEGLPPNLQAKHLKIVENGENPTTIYQSNPSNSQALQNIQPQLSMVNALHPSQLPTTTNSNNQNTVNSTMTNITNTTATHIPLQIENTTLPINNNTNSQVNSGILTGSMQIRKSLNGGFLINGQSSGHVRERKDFSKDKIGVTTTTTMITTPMTTQQPQSLHYIPKNFIRNADNKKKSKRSINLNIKSETVNDDDSVINITINLTGAKTQNAHKSLERGEELHFMDKDKKKVSSTRNAKTNLLNNFFQIAKNNNLKKYNPMVQNVIRKEDITSPLEPLAISSPKNNQLKNQIKIYSPNNGYNIKPKSLERRKQTMNVELGNKL